VPELATHWGVGCPLLPPIGSCSSPNVATPAVDPYVYFPAMAEGVHERTMRLPRRTRHDRIAIRGMAEELGKSRSNQTS